ncbi:uncharacterized protein LOC109921491 [Rhincodon typus]|uniref:uncharacterized protein LOC109921491 n=1 Tax=Rhincodon typus TaxID=259920 RepID=UPI00202E905E|nr:uncharacterized protein LOC109921491 [Rhincodon typus]
MMAAATVTGASESTAPRNECLTQKARPVKPTVANKENCPRPVRPEKGAAMSGSRLPIPVKKLKVKSVPDFKKLHQQWDKKFLKKQATSKKACTQPIPFTFATSRGAKSTQPVSADHNLQIISPTTVEKELAVSEGRYLVGANNVIAATDQTAVESKPIQTHGSGLAAHQECGDLGSGIATLKLDQNTMANKENCFVPCQANITPSKTKSSYIQNSASEIKPPLPPEKAKIEVLRTKTIKPNTDNSEDFVSNPMALQSILSNVGINAFNVTNHKLSLAHTVSMKTNIQNHEPSNPKQGNNDGMALGNAPSTLDDENIFSNFYGKSSMTMRAPEKDSAPHCKYPAQSPYVMGRSSYMPGNRPTLPLAWGRASCIAKLGTRGVGTEISSPSTILQPIKLYNQVSSRHHFSSQKSARCKPDGPDFNLMERACESNTSAPPFVPAGGAGTWKSDTKGMQTPNRVLQPSNYHFSSTRAPSSQNVRHPNYMPTPPSSVVATYKPVNWSNHHSEGKTDGKSTSDHIKDGEYLPMDQIVLRLFSDPEEPEVEKATETPSLKEELERPKTNQGPSLVDLKLVKLKNIELLSQQLQKELQEVKVIEETLTESSCEGSVPAFPEEHPNLGGAVLKNRTIDTASKQQHAEERVISSQCTPLTSIPTPKLMDWSLQMNSVSGTVKCLPTMARQSEISLPSAKLALNVMDMLPTSISHSSSHLHTSAQGPKFQSSFFGGSRDRSTLLWSSMKQRFSETFPGYRKPFPEALLDEEVSCCLTRAIQSPDKITKRERNCANPVAKILQQQEVMHFVPIELHYQPESSPTISDVFL